MNSGRPLLSFVDISKVTKTPIGQIIHAKRNTFVNSINGDYFDQIFAGSTELSLTRQDVFSYFAKNIELGILAAFVWGFPTGGRRRMTKAIIDNIENLKMILNSVKNAELSEKEFSALNSMKGLNFATNTKFLYFARAKIEQSPCLIFDKMVKEFLSINRSQEYQHMFSYFDKKYGYGIEFKIYREYVIKTNEIAQSLDGLNGDALELYFFQYSPSRRRKMRYAGS